MTVQSRFNDSPFHASLHARIPIIAAAAAAAAAASDARCV